MNRSQKFKYVMLESIKNKQQPLALKIVLILIGLRGLYSFTGSWLLTLASVVGIILPGVLGLAWVISSGSDEYFNSYKQSIESGSKTPNSKSVNTFVIIYVVVVCSVVSYLVLKDSNI